MTTKSSKPKVGMYYGIRILGDDARISKCMAAGEDESIFRYRNLGASYVSDHTILNSKIVGMAAPQSIIVRAAMEAGTLFLNLDYSNVIKD